MPGMPTAAEPLLLTQTVHPCWQLTSELCQGVCRVQVETRRQVNESAAAAASAPPRRRAPTQASTHCFTFFHLITSISAAADRTGQLSASGAVLHLVGLAGRGAGACYDTDTGCFRRCSWQLSLRLAKRGLRLAGTVRERPRPTSEASGLSNLNLRSRRALAHSKQRGAPWAQHARHRRPNGRARSGDEAFWAKAAAKRPLLLIVRTGKAHAGAAGACL